MTGIKRSLVPSYLESFHYTQTASYQRLDPRSFPSFPKLPPEIRFKIWYYATSVPRIHEADEQSIFQNMIPLPPLLSVCRESREECLKAYNTRSDRRGREWMRFDGNILFFKNLNFCDAFERSNFTDCIQRWDSKGGLEVTDKSNKWKGRPRFFERVQMLAVHRDVLTQTFDDYECIIRHFFPKLKLLIVLIDDGIAIDKAWKIENGNFGVYEADWGEFPPRWEFTNASTPPFTKVSVDNRAYEDYIQKEMTKRFKMEEKDYKGYVAPALRVKGCWLPPGEEVQECGRWPDGWSGCVYTLAVD